MRSVVENHNSRTQASGQFPNVTDDLGRRASFIDLDDGHDRRGFPQVLGE